MQCKKSRILNQTGASSQIQHSQRPCFCIFIQWLYFYTFCLLSRKPENRLSSPFMHNRFPPCEQVPRRMFTTYRSGCEQPLKRMFTRTSALVHTAVCIENRRNPMFAWIYKECLILQASGFVEQGIPGTQDLLLRFVAFVNNRLRLRIQGLK